MNVSAPLVSVCIANYNGMDVIDDCLRSVLAQQGDLAIETIVHDDASNEDSAGHIRASYPQVQLVVSPNKDGFYIANNRMMARVRDQFILQLNNLRPVL